MRDYFSAARAEAGTKGAAHWVHVGAASREANWGNVPKDGSLTLEQAVQHGLNRCSWLETCIGTRAKSAASVPWVMYNTSTREVQASAPEAALIMNPKEMTKSHFVAMMCMHHDLVGNALTHILRSGKNARGLEMLDPDQVERRVAKHAEENIYLVKPRSKAQAEPIKDVDIVHVINTNPSNIYWGRSPLVSLRTEIEILREIGIGTLALIRNKATPDGFFSTEQQLNPSTAEALSKAIHEKTTGDNKGRSFVASHGLAWHQMALSPADMEWVAAQVRALCALSARYSVSIFRILPDASTFANFEAALKMEWQLGVIPLLRALSEALSLRILTPDQLAKGWQLVADLGEVEVLKGSLEDEATAYSTFVAHGVKPSQAAQAVGLPFSWDHGIGEMSFSRDLVELLPSEGSGSEGDA